MTTRARLTLFAVGLAGFAPVLLLGLLEMPSAGTGSDHYRERAVAAAVDQVGAANVVSAVLFDLRAWDTFGEVLALVAAAVGLQLLLRQLSDEEDEIAPRDAAPDRPEPSTSDAVRVVSLGLVGPVVFLSIYVAVRGHVTVGAGFQAGALAAVALALVYLAGRYSAMHRVVPPVVLDSGEAIGAGGYAVYALLGLALSGSVLANLGGSGSFGSLLSSGSLPVLSVVVAIEAAAAVMLIVTEFQHQTLELRDGSS